MEIIDPGHKYKVLTLDGTEEQILTFVKRFDPSNLSRFPGNKNAYPGTTIQSVVRCLLDRIKYLQNQIPHNNNLAIETRLHEILWLLEDRAAERHGYDFDYLIKDVNEMPMCNHCGHVICEKLGNVIKH